MSDANQATADKGIIQNFCSDVWWIILLRGIAVLILGILLITKPGLTAMVFVQFLGAYFLVDGIFTIVNSLMGRKHLSGWGWGLLLGGLEILTGALIFAHPLLSTWVTATSLVFLVAILAIVFGLVGIVNWFQIRKEVQGEWAMLVGGILAIIFGIILFLKPETSAKAYLIVMGISAVLGGLMQIYNSFRIRSIGKHGLASRIS